MKKSWILGLMGMALMMQACHNDEELTQGTAKQVPIAFGGMVVSDMSTRAIVDETSGLAGKKFYLYGWKGSRQIFTKQEVTVTANATRSTGYDGVYSPLQYWANGQTYNFSAIYPQDAVPSDLSIAKGTGPTISFATDGVTDLLYAQSNEIKYTAGSSETVVPLVFKHQLSKVKFTLKNGVADNTLTIQNFKIKDIKKSGSVTLSTKSPVWDTTSASAEDWTMTFGTTSFETDASVTSDEVLIIPTTADYTIEFQVKISGSDQDAEWRTLTANLGSTTFEAGHAYSFSATIVGEKIEFSVEVTNWVSESDSDLGNITA